MSTTTTSSFVVVGDHVGTQSAPGRYRSLSPLTVYSSPEYDPSTPPALPIDELVSFEEHDEETREFLEHLRSDHPEVPPGLVAPVPSPEEVSGNVAAILNEAQARASFGSVRAASPTPPVSSIRQARLAAVSRPHDWLVELRKSRVAQQKMAYQSYVLNKEAEGRRQLLEQGALAVKPCDSDFSVWIPVSIVMEGEWWRADPRGHLSWMDAVRAGTSAKFVIQSEYSAEEWREVARFCRGEVTLESARTRELIDAPIQELQNWQLWSRLYAYSVGIGQGGPLGKVLSILAILTRGRVEGGLWLPTPPDTAERSFVEVL